MRTILLIALLSLITSEDIDNLVVKLKQSLSRNTKDIPSYANNYIRNLNGFTRAIKQKMLYTQVQNLLNNNGFPAKVYQSCIESSFKGITYYDSPDYLASGNNIYSLNYYVLYCEKVDNNNVNVVGVRGKYSGTLVQQTQKWRITRCKRFLWVKKCKTHYEDRPRPMNGGEYGICRDVLRTKYNQDALDQLNKIR